MGRCLKILLLSRYFPPEIGTAANLFYELAKGLADRGHSVNVVTGFPWYNLKTVPGKYRGRLFMKENMGGVDVTRLAFPVFGPKKIKLAAGHMTAPFSSFLGGLLSERPDVIFIYSPPLFMGLAGWLLNLFRGVPFIMGVQDLHPQCYIDQGVLKSRLMIRVLEGIEKFCYGKSSLITVHSGGNKRHIVEVKGIDEKKVKVLPNWIDTDEMRPLPRDNEFSRRHGLNGKFVVGYAGTLGMSQGLMSVVESARILKERDDIEFFIVGDGIEKEKLVERVREYGLGNVRFLEMQPKSVYPYVVASSDVGLVTLNSRVRTPVVPSKILSLMAAARPVLASMPLDGDAPKLIEKAGCGICIGPEDPESLAEKILFLSDNPGICAEFARRGREFVVREMSLKRAVGELEACITDMLGEA
ncbi:MAG: glycosyltransferase family 4 protein [Nitrospirae bacterium]|nr:glycosyltransferase family 4 protein [Nitrospirota bacterium]